MNETALPPSPAELFKSAAARSEPAPAPARRPSSVLRFLRAVLGYRLRNPLRCLAIAFLLALTGLGLWVAGRYLWAGHHLRAARSAAERYHNARSFFYVGRWG